MGVDTARQYVAAGCVDHRGRRHGAAQLHDESVADADVSDDGSATRCHCSALDDQVHGRTLVVWPGVG